VSARDYRDEVIEELANSEAILRERVTSLEADNDIRQELLSEALSALHRVTVQGDRFQQRIAELLVALQDARDEARRLMAQLRETSAPSPSSPPFFVTDYSGQPTQDRLT
jgi:hypothetical protein